MAATSGAPDARTWDELRTTLRGIARAVFAPVEFAGSTSGVVRLVAPNEPHRDKCEQHRADVEAAFAAHGLAVRVELEVDGAPTGPVPVPDAAAIAEGAPPAALDDDEAIDLDDLVDAPPGSVPTPLERITQAFPGAQLVDERD